MIITLYTDTIERDVSKWVKSLSITRSIQEPYESARVNLQAPFGLEVLPRFDETGATDLDLWVVIYQDEVDEEGAVFLGCLAGVTRGFYASTGEDVEGGIRARDLTLNFESWLKPVRRGEIYMSGQTSVRGHILNIEQFGERFRALGSLPFQSRNVGDALQGFWTELAQNYRLPDKLTGQTLDIAVKVVFNEGSAKQSAPSRESTQKGVYGLALNAVSGSIAGGGATAWGIIRSVFSADTNMIELFTSLELTKGTERGPLEERLRARPVLIYRMKPFTFGENHKEPDAALRRVANTSEATEAARAISLNDVISVDISQSDADRVNGVYVNTPLTPSRGVELFGLAGEPVLDREDIDRQGLRLFKGSWPFFPQGKRRRATAEGYGADIQEVIDLAAAIIEDDHRFFNGTIQTRGRLDIKAGEWVKLDLSRYNKRSLVCYAESVVFNLSVRGDGVQMLRSSIEFTRGYYD